MTLILLSSCSANAHLRAFLLRLECLAPWIFYTFAVGSLTCSFVSALTVSRSLLLQGKGAKPLAPLSERAVVVERKTICFILWSLLSNS